MFFLPEMMALAPLICVADVQECIYSFSLQSKSELRKKTHGNSSEKSRRRILLRSRSLIR